MPARLDTRGEAFGDRFRSLRERAGLTQEELANRAGLTPNAVSALERGTRTRPYPHTVREGIALSEQNHDLANLAYFLEAFAIIESAEHAADRVPVLLRSSTA